MTTRSRNSTSPLRGDCATERTVAFAPAPGSNSKSTFPGSSLSRIVTVVKTLVPTTAAPGSAVFVRVCAALNVTWKVSLPSPSTSSLIGTSTTLVESPGTKKTAPEPLVAVSKWSPLKKAVALTAP